VRADALAEVFGSGEFTERMKRRQATIATVDAGFMRCELFVARAGPMMVLPFAASRAAAVIDFYDRFVAPRPSTMGR